MVLVIITCTKKLMTVAVACVVMLSSSLAGADTPSIGAGMEEAAAAAVGADVIKSSVQVSLSSTAANVGDSKDNSTVPSRPLKNLRVRADPRKFDLKTIADMLADTPEQAFTLVIFFAFFVYFSYFFVIGPRRGVAAKARQEAKRLQRRRAFSGSPDAKSRPKAKRRSDACPAEATVRAVDASTAVEPPAFMVSEAH